MDYNRIYYQIIERAKVRILSDTEYFENHHIVPLSMGGSNLEENIVKLLAREHYICHWLLYKIHKNSEMAYAWWMMSNNDGSKYHKDRKRQTSRKYEYAKRAFSKHIGKIHKGRKLSKEHKQKLSLSKLGDKNPMFGKKHSEEHKQYLSEINSGDKNGFYGKTHTEEFKMKLSEYAKLRTGEKSNAYGYHHTEETKQKYSELYKGKPRTKPHEIVICPHCNKSGIKPNMKRWHFDNCKELNSTHE